ncbi:hypothetical protein F5879DRAFT_814150 [Lentinula edodes]|nr:hypothetical protein F5879DRAFT_814150 [Lentinula edodes]
MKVMAATKIRGNGAFLLMGSVAEAESMKVGDRLVRFCEAWGSSAILRPNYHEVVVESLLVETMIENAYERSCIEKANELPANSIAQIRWIKPIGKRRNDQRYADTPKFWLDVYAVNCDIFTYRFVSRGL